MSQNPMDMVIGVDESVARDPETASKHRRIASEAKASGDRPLAVAEYRKALSADPHDPESMFHLGYLLDLMGEEDEAVALYERSLEVGSPRINTLMNLAVLYEDRGEHARAEKCLKQVLDTNPNHGRARLFMKDVQASREMVIDDDGERDVAKRNALFDIPVTDFDLSVRARNCLKKMNIRTLGDLLRVSEAELLGYRNLGEATLIEIKQMLAARGLRLGQRVDERRRQSRRELFQSLQGGGEGALGKSVADIDFSVRVRKALQLLGVQSLGDLAARTEAELMGVKNFGATSLTEVHQKLSEHGVKLRELDF
jgi:DNA-directed RNA polymerase subunit alpha